MEKKDFKIYEPVEELMIRILAQHEEQKNAKEQAAAEPTTAEICEAALETKRDFTKALELDLMLLEAEEKVGLMDGNPVGGD